MPNVIGPGPGMPMNHPMMMHDRDGGPPPGMHHMGPSHGQNMQQPIPPNQPHHMPPQMGGPHGPPIHQMHSQQMQMHRMPHFIGQPELRIYEMNKRLQQRGDESDSHWWDSFASDFFEDDATITIIAFLEDGPKRYTIGRILIPRYFRSIFESGVGELWFNLRITREAPHPPLLTLDSDCSQIMNMQRPPGLTVIVDGRFTLDFVIDDLRIRSWTFNIRSFREMIARPLLSCQDPNAFEHLSKNITRCGIPFNTMNFLRMSVILEPMQELMSRQKAYSLSPRDCLKTTLFQKWQRMMAPQGQPPIKQGPVSSNNNNAGPNETSKGSNKRRKRKGSSTNSDASSTSGRATKRKQSPGPVPIPNVAQPGEVMIVGEPTLMGGDFGDEDERRITRLENTQFDPNQCNPGNQMMLMGGNGPPPHMMQSGPNMIPPGSNSGPPLLPPGMMPPNASGPNSQFNGPMPPHMSHQQQQMMMANRNMMMPGSPFGNGPLTPQQQQMFMQHHHQMMQSGGNGPNRPPMMMGPNNGGDMMNMGHNNLHPGNTLSPGHQPHTPNNQHPASMLHQNFSGPNTPSSGQPNIFPIPHMSQANNNMQMNPHQPDSFHPPRSSSANEMMKRSESSNNSPAILPGNMLMMGGQRSNNATPPPNHPGSNNGQYPLSMMRSSPLVNSGGSRSIPSSPGMNHLPPISSSAQNSNPQSVPPNNTSRNGADDE